MKRKFFTISGESIKVYKYLYIKLYDETFFQTFAGELISVILFSVLSEVRDDKIENSGDLNKRAAEAKASEAAMERLIQDFQVFLRSRVSRYATGRDAAQRDEMLGTAMLAFYESVQKYDASKGHFFSFANQVVCERLIDYNRREKRHDGVLTPLEGDDEQQQTAQSAAINEVSIRAYKEDQNREYLAYEIAQFKDELSAWGITLDSLVLQSPKHSRLREEYKKIVAIIAHSPDIVQTIQLKRYFPIKAIANITGLPPKKLERARNFILASLIIKMGDYSYLSEYISD